MVVSQLEPVTIATDPVPEIGDLIGQTSATLEWTPGMTATASEVFFGTSPDALTSKGQTSDSSMPVEGLEYRVTYYWRVDSIEGDTVYTGDVWEFTVAPKEDFNPSPLDGSLFVDPNFIDPNVVLSWAPGTARVRL